MITGRQLRDARELLGISRHELATHSGVSRLSVRLWESYGDELPSALAPNLARTTSYLHSAGIIEFRPDGSVAVLDKPARTLKASIVNEVRQ